MRVHRHAALTSAFSAAARLYLKDGAKVDVFKTPDALELNDFEELFDEKPQELASRITAPPDSRQSRNTCYMNATLQCLLTRLCSGGTFRGETFLKDVDDGSALNVAMAYGALACRFRL